MNGKQIKNFSTLRNGHGAITLQAGELDAGIYLYSLVVDGQIIGTKQMILTD